jgi:hypothetical protein
VALVKASNSYRSKAPRLRVEQAIRPAALDQRCYQQCYKAHFENCVENCPDIND